MFKPTDMENLILRMGCLRRSWFLESGNTSSATLSLYLYHIRYFIGVYRTNSIFDYARGINLSLYGFGDFTAP